MADAEAVGRTFGKEFADQHTDWFIAFDCPAMSARKALARLILFAFLASALICFCFGGTIVITIGLSPGMASSLLPPDYPNGKVIDTKQEWTANAKTEIRIYQTVDSFQDVLAFMEKYMPDFRQGKKWTLLQFCGE